MKKIPYQISALCVATLALSGCLATMPGSDQAATTQQTEPAKEKPAPAAAAAPASGNGKEVKGINGWTGSVTGTPAKKTKFTRLTIGMSPQQVTDMIGQPKDQSRNITGKALIPFFYGGGGHKMVYYYKGMGRLIFANNAAFSTGMGLTVIEHDASEDGYP